MKKKIAFLILVPIFIIAVAVIFWKTAQKPEAAIWGSSDGADKSRQAENDGTKARKIIFYRNPMNPSITSKVPAKDQMGMDYIPVYEEEETVVASDRVISKVKIKKAEAQLADVETQPVAKGRLYKEIRTVGKVAYDPALTIAEEEFVSSLKAYDKIKQGDIAEIKERATNLVDAAKKKLMLLGLSEEQIVELEDTRQLHSNLVLPQSKMWVYGELYEYELGWVKRGEKVKITTLSLPGEEFEGIIASLNPVLDPKTRSVTFRVEVENPGLKLKPEMYVDVDIMSAYLGPEGQEENLFIPKNAVLDTGKRKIVWVDKGDGEYEGIEVAVGPEAIFEKDNMKMNVYPVLNGLKEGVLVVSKANFLIDSQSQISGVAASAYGGALGAGDKEVKGAGSED